MYDTNATLKWILETKKAKATQKNYLCAVQYALRGHEGVEEICKVYRAKIKELEADLAQPAPPPRDRRPPRREF